MGSRNKKTSKKLGSQTSLNKKTLLPWAAALAVLLLPTVIGNIFKLPTTQQDPGTKVIGVNDGDTLVLEGKIRVRLRHTDAPELEYCGGKEAKKQLEKLVMRERVRLEEQVPDQHGRGMALVYVKDTLINRELLTTGWVRYHHDISSKKDDLKASSEYAKKKLLGIYETCQSKENKKNPKCNIKGNIDDGNGKKRYYLPGCAQYAFTIIEKDVGEEWFCSEKEALKAGYSKTETC